MSKNPGYYQNSYLATPPVGSIMEYLGTIDPDGWIICNGTARTNNQDGRYNALSSLGIGTGGSGTSNYTPPDLRGKFSIGASSTYPLNTTQGNATVTLSEANLPSHSHGMEHQHFAGADWGGGSGYNNYAIRSANSGTNAFCVNASNNGVQTNGASITTTGLSGGNTAITTIPPYLAVNYIIKY